MNIVLYQSQCKLLIADKPKLSQVNEHFMN